MRQVQHEAIESGFLDLLGEEKQSVIELNDTASTLTQLALVYVDLLLASLEKEDVASSGELSDSISPTSVSVNGTLYTIGIRAKEYASYQDQGVNGWAKSQKSIFSFRTKGVDPKGKMVKSIKDWLRREGKSARNVPLAISSRERRGQQLDQLARNAVSAAYLIKKYGIKKTKFWTNATEEMEVYVENEFGKALKIDIINNLT